MTFATNSNSWPWLPLLPAIGQYPVEQQVRCPRHCSMHLRGGGRNPITKRGQRYAKHFRKVCRRNLQRLPSVTKHPRLFCLFGHHGSASELAN